MDEDKTPLEPLEFLDAIAQIARQEKAPQVRIQEQVLGRMRELATEIRVKGFFATASLTAALVMVVLGGQVYFELTDPLGIFFELAYTITP